MPGRSEEEFDERSRPAQGDWRMKTVSKMGRGAAVPLILATVAVATPLQAQTSALEEVVITARKRDESFRDVPVTVNVFTEQAIRAAGIEKPRDFIALVPNMTLVETQNAGNAFVVVRGVSQARNSEPSVAVLVDGILETDPAAFNQELYDVQQIEVLKGPQGALYGRNAIGGAILIRTKLPSDELEGHARLGFGNGESKRAQLGLSGPLNESKTLKYRATVNYYDTDGFPGQHVPEREGRPGGGSRGSRALPVDAERAPSRAICVWRSHTSRRRRCIS